VVCEASRSFTCGQKAPVQDDIEREERVIEMEATPTRERLEEFEFLML
jgi:hypothetical protein